ncbi:hypothetical protein BDZ88DRAFT_441242 [Geranomyces variabilis]|nr:hypothetical protein BDZ88DRAFT_441242 [Geranomyces variabilis]KAJ3132387.1 hypothetical protein HDU90_006901 [Geranomyces variabilis]
MAGSFNVLLPGPPRPTKLLTHGGIIWVSDQDLAIALDLEEQTEEHETLSDQGSQIYYVRSWALTVDEVRDLAENGREDGQWRQQQPDNGTPRMFRSKPPAFSPGS